MVAFDFLALGSIESQSGADQSSVHGYFGCMRAALA